MWELEWQWDFLGGSVAQCMSAWWPAAINSSSPHVVNRSGVPCGLGGRALGLEKQIIKHRSER